MKSKYPILLVHGILLKDTFFFKSFGKIPNILRKEGFCVYCSTNDGVGTIENNAIQLKEQIEKILEKEKTQKINIIAHSKGGLDCKYMIQNLNMHDKVASLTTICTPHKGSQLASTILNWPKWFLNISSFFINVFYKIIGDKKPNVLKACEQLKAITVVQDNNVDFYDKVYCQSYSATLKKGTDDLLMTVPYIMLKKHDKNDSDGMVSNESARFGEYKGNCIDGSISHVKIVDLMIRKKDENKVYEFYKMVCNELIKMGF